MDLTNSLAVPWFSLAYQGMNDDREARRCWQGCIERVQQAMGRVERSDRDSGRGLCRRILRIIRLGI